MALITTGQMTLTDHNDGKNIVAYITASLGASQAWDPTETDTYTPSWAANNVLTARVYVNSSEVAASLTNKEWSTGAPLSIGGTDLNNNTVTANVTNLATDRITYFFEGDYTDPQTNLLTHIIAQIELMRIRLGTNATWIRISGADNINEGVGSVKGWANLKADLYRGSALDDTLPATAYKWFISPFGAGDQLDANHALVTSSPVSIKFRTTAQSNGSATPFPLTDSNTPTTTAAPADGTGSDMKEILIRESAVSDIAFFKVQITDSDGGVYEAYATVYDVSDPYDVKLLSSAGDKFQNGNGTTNITPEVWNGSTLVPNTGWTFDWTSKDRNGNPQGFIETAKSAAARTITTSAAGRILNFTGTFTSAQLPVQGDLVKIFDPSTYTTYYHEVLSVTNVTNAQVVLKSTGVSSSFVTPLTTDPGTAYTGFQFFVCTYDWLVNGTVATAVTGTHTTTNMTVSSIANMSAGTCLRLTNLTTGAVKYVKVLTAVSLTVTFDTAATSSYAWMSNALVLADFPAGSRVEIIDPTRYGEQGTRKTFAGTAIVVTGDDVDVKGTIFCGANRPD